MTVRLLQVEVRLVVSRSEWDEHGADFYLWQMMEELEADAERLGGSMTSYGHAFMGYEQVAVSEEGIPTLRYAVEFEYATVVVITGWGKVSFGSEGPRKRLLPNPPKLRKKHVVWKFPPKELNDGVSASQPVEP